MRIVLLFACTLAASFVRAEDAPRPEILVMDLQHSEDVKPDVARTLSELVTAEISSDERVHTLSGSDIRNMLELEGEKQAMGCETDASCLAEVANAMGARFVVFGRVSTLGGLIVLTLNMLDAERGQALSRTTVQAASLDKIVAELSGAVAKLLVKPLELVEKERAERAAKQAVAAAESDAERQRALDAAALASRDAEAARTSTDVSMVDAAATPDAPPASDEGGGFLSTALLVGGTGITVFALVTGAVALVGGTGLAYLVATDKNVDVDDREANRAFSYTVTAAALVPPTLLVVVGVATAGASFALE